MNDDPRQRMHISIQLVMQEAAEFVETKMGYSNQDARAILIAAYVQAWFTPDEGG